MREIDQQDLSDARFEKNAAILELVESLADESLSPKEHKELRADYCYRHGVTDRTINNYIARYGKGGVWAFLTPIEGEPYSRIHDRELADAILNLVKELLTRTVPKLRQLLSADERFTDKIGNVSDRSLYRFLLPQGYTPHRRHRLVRDPLPHAGQPYRGQLRQDQARVERIPRHQFTSQYRRRSPLRSLRPGQSVYLQGWHVHRDNVRLKARQQERVDHTGRIEGLQPGSQFPCPGLLPGAPRETLQNSHRQFITPLLLKAFSKGVYMILLDNQNNEKFTWGHGRLNFRRGNDKKDTGSRGDNGKYDSGIH